MSLRTSRVFIQSRNHFKTPGLSIPAFFRCQRSTIDLWHGGLWRGVGWRRSKFLSYVSRSFDSKLVDFESEVARGAGLRVYRENKFEMSSYLAAWPHAITNEVQWANLK